MKVVLIVDVPDNENPFYMVEKLSCAYEKEYFAYPYFEIVNEEELREIINARSESN